MDNCGCQMLQKLTGAWPVWIPPTPWVICPGNPGNRPGKWEPAAGVSGPRAHGIDLSICMGVVL
jgi:hypothetical protein